MAVNSPANAAVSHTLIKSKVTIETLTIYEILRFEERVKGNGGRLKKTTILALARKLLVALRKYVSAGVVIEGAVMNAA
jgi:hypothetical protein